MIMSETGLEGLVVIENEVFYDERGYLSEVYKSNEFYDKFSFQNKLELEVTSQKGVLRGLHYQIEPYAQAKIVRVVSGEILDVVVDIRKSSKTFGKHYTVKLNDIDKKQLYIPEGFAHGYYVLSEDAKMIYKMDNIYSMSNAKGIAYDDRTLNIDWKLFDNPLLSEKDSKLPTLEDAHLFE